MESCDEIAPAAFDDETLGGYVSYSAIVEPVRHLKGGFKVLVVRYDPLSIPAQTPSTLVGAAQTGNSVAFNGY